jgi:hypothetical protein
MIGWLGGPATRKSAHSVAEIRLGRWKMHARHELRIEQAWWASDNAKIATKKPFALASLAHAVVTDKNSPNSQKINLDRMF